MAITQPEQQLQRPLPPDDRDPPARDVIFTANGSRRASRLIWKHSTALIGMESLNTRPPSYIPIDFVDWPFSKLADYGGNVEAVFEDHLQVVKREEPKYAVAPDLDEYTDWGTVMEWADELRHHCETVIVVPKSFHPGTVPRRYRVGMPCQDRYGPCPWGWPEYAECDEVHLLGGSPVKHMQIFGEKYALGKGPYVVPIESVDTSVPVTPAKYGEVFCEVKHGWRKTDGAFYEVLPESYQRLRLALNPDRKVPEPEEIADHNQPVGYPIGYPDEDLLHPMDEAPFPGRAYFYQSEVVA